MDKIIAAVTKTTQEEIRIFLKTWKGKRYIDMRVYFEPDGGGEKLPSKKGITFSVELWGEFQDALEKLGQALEAED